MTIRRISVSAGTAGIVALAVWLLWPSPGPDSRSTSPESPSIPGLRNPSIGASGDHSGALQGAVPQPVAASPGPHHALAAVFPSKAHHVCAAPEGLAQGRYNAGEADVLVSNGETVVWSGNNPGDATVRWLGRWLGDISWADGHCEWAEVPDVEVTFVVAAGGIHTVAGCPVGEAVQTAEDGSVRVLVPEGQTCTARVVGGREGLQMGPKVTVIATETATVEMDAELEPLTDDEIDQGLTILRRMGAFHVEQAQAELDRLTGVGAGVPEAAWLIEAAEDRMAFMQGELKRVESEETEMEVLREFLLSQTN
jgi:hypothetical protein